jgi:hypothetical protein
MHLGAGTEQCIDRVLEMDHTAPEVQERAVSHGFATLTTHGVTNQGGTTCLASS